MSSCNLVSSVFLQNGWTPLFFAAFGGHAAVVSLLLRNDANMLITDKVKERVILSHTYSIVLMLWLFSP